jgi:hypothetical protein
LFSVLSPSEVCASARCCGPVQRPPVALVPRRLPGWWALMRRRLRHRLLASPVSRQAVAGNPVTGSRRSAPRFFAFEDPPPAGVDLVFAAGSRAGRRSLSRHRRSPASSPGVSKIAPPSVSTRCVRSRREDVLRRLLPSSGGLPLPPAPSAPAVPPGFDGLLRCAPRRPRAFRGPGQHAAQLPWAFLLQPTLGFRPFRLLPPCLPSSDPLGASRRRSARIEGQQAALAGASPVLPYPSKRFPRQQPSRRHRRALPSRRYRPLRLAVARGANRGADSAGGCRPQGLAPLPSPLAGPLSPAILPRCSPGLVPGRGREERASTAPSGEPHGAAVGVGARVEPVCTRPLDRVPTSEDERLVLVGSEGSPRGSALPAGSSPRSGGARRVSAGDVASPRLARVSHAAQQHAEPRRPKDRFLIPISYRYTQPARRASAAPFLTFRSCSGR